MVSNFSDCSNSAVMPRFVLGKEFGRGVLGDIGINICDVMVMKQKVSFMVFLVWLVSSILYENLSSDTIFICCSRKGGHRFVPTYQCDNQNASGVMVS